jgi:hypothetical protein
MIAFSEEEKKRKKNPCLMKLINLIIKFTKNNDKKI